MFRKKKSRCLSQTARYSILKECVSVTFPKCLLWHQLLPCQARAPKWFLYIDPHFNIKIYLSLMVPSDSWLHEDQFLVKRCPCNIFPFFGFSTTVGAHRRFGSFAYIPLGSFQGCSSHAVVTDTATSADWDLLA